MENALIVNCDDDHFDGGRLDLGEEVRLLMLSGALKLRSARESMEDRQLCRCREDGHPCRYCKLMASLDATADKVEALAGWGQ